jgi:DNA repair protein RAD50
MLFKKQIEEKRAEFISFSNEIKALEEKKKIIDEEALNRAAIKKRDELISMLSEQVNFSELEDLIRKKSEKLSKTTNQYMKKRVETELEVKKLDELYETIKATESYLSEVKLEYANRHDSKEVFTFNGRESNDIENLYEYARSFIDDKRRNIIDQTRVLENLKCKLKIINENVKLKGYKEKALNIQEEFKDINFEKLSLLRKKLNEYEDKMKRVLGYESIIVGELKQLDLNLNSIKIDLVYNYKEINVKYAKDAVELKTLELSLSDIDKCINALDKAIVDFHKVKLDELNSILRELWVNTYKGDDIDYIEIKAETSESRAYNYTVMMLKNGVSMKMRGRCSAGQKMIASILVRLALDDAFSSSCNILALDEPTTNLDKDNNIESLALTLSNLIRERVNSQIIIITHDEEFVELINRDGIDYFYKLRRDSKGHYHIERHSIYK